MLVVRTFLTLGMKRSFITSSEGENIMEKKEELKIRHIISSLEDLQYGSVLITVHDGEITQVDTTEKKRFPLVKGRAVKVR